MNQDISNELTLYNYKEPLKKVVDGYGYYGAILVTKDGRGLQCHICGEVFRELGTHINRIHSIRAVDYKEKYQLAVTTALVSEERRQQMIETSRRWWESLSREKRESTIKRLRQAAKKLLKEKGAHGKGITLETKNKRGICPDQLLDKIREVKDKIGHTPSKFEFITETKTQRYIHLIYKVYGSWKNALKILGYDPVLGSVKRYNRDNRRYTKEELIDYLKMFYQENGYPPSASDCRRSLLPDILTFTRMFGTFQSAREAAGIIEKPKRSRSARP